MSDTIRDIMPLKDGVTLYGGIGNTLRGDDGAGIYAVSLIIPNENVKTLEAWTSPEEVYEEAVNLRPNKVVLIDAADMGLPEGSIQILYEDTISERMMSTHKIPVPLISRLIREETGAETVICGIQPLRVEMGSEMCQSVRTACETAARVVNNAFKW